MIYPTSKINYQPYCRLLSSARKKHPVKSAFFEGRYVGKKREKVRKTLSNARVGKDCFHIGRPLYRFAKLRRSKQVQILVRFLKISFRQVSRLGPAADDIVIEHLLGELPASSDVEHIPLVSQDRLPHRFKIFIQYVQSPSHLMCALYHSCIVYAIWIEW